MPNSVPAKTNDTIPDQDPVPAYFPKRRSFDLPSFKHDNMKQIRGGSTSLSVDLLRQKKGKKKIHELTDTKTKMASPLDLTSDVTKVT